MPWPCLRCRPAVEAPNTISWSGDGAKPAIVNFGTRTTTDGGPDFIPPADRIAVFDNDGTLWCEKPMPLERGFILARLAAMVERDATLCEQQPWKAAYERDYTWLGEASRSITEAMTAMCKVLIGGMRKAFEEVSVEDYGADAGGFSHRFTAP